MTTQEEQQFLSGVNLMDRRISDCWDPALIMGVLYTMVYAFAITCVVFVDIPDSNGDIVKLLLGAMTVIQTTIVQYFFGNTKNADTNQKLIALSKERTDSVMRKAVEASTPTVAINGKH